MAISFDSSAYLGVGTGTTYTKSYTCGSGSDRMLYAFVYVGTNVTPTSVTYAGAAMSLIASSVGTPSVFLYGIAAPASGANNLVVTTATSQTVVVDVCSYAGVKQTELYDAYNVDSTGSSSPYRSTLTVVQNNCWGLLCGFTGNNVTGSEQTMRVNTNTNFCMADTNSSKSPGSLTMGYTTNGTAGVVRIMISFAPVPPITTTQGFFLVASNK